MVRPDCLPFGRLLPAALPVDAAGPCVVYELQVH